MNENVTVCITPKGEKPVLHFSQFDNENVFTVTVLADDGESAAVLTGLDIEFRIRKTDSHVVTIAPESVAYNVITFKSTEQMCACCGQNIASVTLMKDDMVISTLDIIVDIQRDILSGGLTSESDIRNLTSQIEQIVPEVIGDDYYNKQEVDEKIAEIPTFDPSNYYDKEDVDDLLADKADSDDVMSKVSKYGLIGDVAYFSFDNNCVAPMDDIECDVEAVQSGSGTPSPDNVRPITGHSTCTITVSDSDNTPVKTCTVSFGQTVYKGVADVTNGKVTVTHVLKNIGANDISDNGTSGGLIELYVNGTSNKKNGQTNMLCNNLEVRANASAYAIRGRTGSSSVTFCLPTSDVPDFNSAKTWVTNNPIELVYELATPIEITFTPDTVDTLNGYNKVSSSTGNMKSLTYFSDVDSFLVDLIRACMIGR